MSNSNGVKPYNVCHITTVHPRKDVRIFHKECKSLVAAGYNVTLIVNDGLGSKVEQGIRFIDLGGYTSRFKRMLIAIPLAWWQARKLKQDIYHFHDPELMIAAIALKIGGAEVVYDVHEDLPNDIKNKPWIPTWLQLPLSRTMAKMEEFVGSRIAACVCTTPHITQRFESYGGKVAMLRNFPDIGTLTKLAKTAFDDRAGNENDQNTGVFKLAYAGSIARNRGVVEMVDAVHKAGCRLVLMGGFREPDVYQEVTNSPAWESVDYIGVVDKERVEAEYRQCHAGIAYLYPDTNYVNSLPIKLLEYMRFGLPVICSDFKSWRTIYSGTRACLFVEPCNVSKLTEAVIELKNDRIKAQEMGKSGQAVVFDQYNWESEFTKLESLYGRLLHKSDVARITASGNSE